MPKQLDFLNGSVTAKVLFIGALILLLLVPLGMIESLVRERSHLYDTARADVASAWGAAQTIGGPILIVPFQFTRMAYAQPATMTDELYLLPESLEITGSVEAEERARGIYRVPVYTTRLRVTGRFAVPALGAEYPDLELLWDRAEIALPLADARSVKEPIVLASGKGTTTFEPGGTRIAGFGPQLVARYAELGRGALTAPQAFSFELVLRGTGALEVLPLGNETRVDLASNWPSPSFRGAYLPDRRSVGAAGFAAEWRVLDLGRGYAASWTRAAAPPASVAASAFGIELVTPLSVHATSSRATKYAVLIIGLTFAAYFLFELLATLRLHALQYLLIGLANCVFYLALLALAEHIGFTAAYAASATAATTLIASYSAAVLRSLHRAAPVGALLAVLYGYLYVTLRAEDYALLFGAVGLFAVLAAFMYLTRRIDWYTVSFGAGREPAAGARVQLHA